MWSIKDSAFQKAYLGAFAWSWQDPHRLGASVVVLAAKLKAKNKDCMSSLKKQASFQAVIGFS